jgi:hypothetical protein
VGRIPQSQNLQEQKTLNLETLMAIFIHKQEVTYKDAIGFFSKPDDRVKQIVRAWKESDIKHYFKDEKRFKKMVCKNRKTLRSPHAIKKLFRSKNYCFSTKAEDRKETLYFEDRTTICAQTGRLRQQHRKGPLATIDKYPREHLFLSEERYKFLKEWHEQNCGCGYLPKIKPDERVAKDGKRHIEFACEEKSVSDWHRSGGTVKRREQQHRERRIKSALKNILGFQAVKNHGK